MNTEQALRDTGWNPKDPNALSMEQAFNAVNNNSEKYGLEKSYSDFNGDWYGYLQYMANRGDADSIDRLLNYMMTEQSSLTAREWTADREDTQYQRLVKDLKAAGINPYALLNSGGSPVSSASSGNSYSGAYASNAELKKETNSAKWVSIFTGVLSTLLMAVAIAV